MDIRLKEVRASLGELDVPKVDLKTFDSSSGYTYGICASPSGDIYLSRGSFILKCNSDTMDLELYAGSSVSGHKNGEKGQAQFDTPLGLMWFDDKVWVVQSHSVRIIEGSQVSTYVGDAKSGHIDGPFEDVRFNNPTHMTELNGRFYLTDSFNHCVRIIDPIAGTVSSIGRKGTISKNGVFWNKNSDLVAGFKYPRGICVSGHRLLVVESSGHTIRELDVENQTVSDFHCKLGKELKFALDIVHSSTNEIFIADTGGDVIQRIDAFRNQTRFIGDKSASSTETPKSTTSRPTAFCISEDGSFYWTEEQGSLRYIHGMFPPKKKHYVDYSLLLENSELSDLSFNQTSSGLEFKLHSTFLYVLEVQNIRAIETCDSPGKTCQNFISFLYGNMNLSLVAPSIEDKAWFVILSEICQTSTELVLWFKRQFEKSIHGLSDGPFLGFLEKILPIKSICDSNYINSILSYSCTRRANRGKESLVLPSHLVQFAAQSLASSEDEGFEPLDSDFSPVDWMTQKLRGWCLGSLLQNPSTDSEVSVREALERVELGAGATPTVPAEPNFTFIIGSEPDQQHFKVHDWVLRSRWPYFQRMMEFGGEEARNKRAALPLFPPTLFRPFLMFAYSSFIDVETILLNDANTMLENGEELNLIDSDGKPTPTFEAFIQHCENMVSDARASRQKWQTDGETHFDILM